MDAGREFREGLLQEVHGCLDLELRHLRGGPPPQQATLRLGPVHPEDRVASLVVPVEVTGRERGGLGEVPVRELGWTRLGEVSVGELGWTPEGKGVTWTVPLTGGLP